MIHPATMDQITCGQIPLSPDRPLRSRTAGNNFRSRPATREAAPEDTVDGVANDVDERVHEPGGRRRGRGRRDRLEGPALAASYRKTLFLYEKEKRGGSGRRSRHAGRPPRLNRHETDKVKLTRGHHFGHYENDLPSI
jgi:hypothetical protein